MREEILEELTAQTVAEGVREMESDDAVYMLEDLPEGGAGGNPRAAAGAPSAPRWSAASITRKAPPGGACRRTSSRCRRSGPSARPSTTCARRRTCRTVSTRFTWSIRRRLQGAVALDACCAPSGRCRSPNWWTRSAVACSPPRTRKRSRACSSNTTWSPRRWSTSGDRLVGVITVDDIVDVIEEEADEDMKALGGVSHDEELSD